MFIHKMYKNKIDIYNRAAELMDLVGLARRYANSYPHELDLVGVVKVLVSLVRCH